MHHKERLVVAMTYQADDVESRSPEPLEISIGIDIPRTLEFRLVGG